MQTYNYPKKKVRKNFVFQKKKKRLKNCGLHERELCDFELYC